MNTYGLFAMALLMSFALVTSLSAHVEEESRQARAAKLRGWAGIIKPPMFCTCEVRCCKLSLEKRRAVAAELNNPTIRHKRCCGCQMCTSLSSSSLS
ncbi:hypothetical protein V1264_015997 [Littorina saxatilis]|uniref:Uncharacterized protein n=1 Tax=Littorina saxatilis TaxID=31220 RepID=A0AAN9BN42_9CAEN